MQPAIYHLQKQQLQGLQTDRNSTAGQNPLLHQTYNSTIKIKNIQKQGNQNYSSDGSSAERFQQANHAIIPKLQKEGNRYSSTQLISNASTKNIKPPSLPLSNNKQSANYIAIDESHQ